MAGAAAPSAAQMRHMSPAPEDDDDAEPVHPNQDEVAKTSTHRQVLARYRPPYRRMS